MEVFNIITRLACGATITLAAVMLLCEQLLELLDYFS
jgi:hypothetical protein